MSRKFINVKETALRLGVSEDWIRKLCRAKIIPGAEKIGRDWLIPVGVKFRVGQPKILEIPRK